MNKLLIIAALAAAFVTGCSEKPATPPPPSPAWPPPVEVGRARLSPDADAVDAGGLIDVYVDVNSGNKPVGAVSFFVSYNTAAFQLISKSGGGSDLHDPAHSSEPQPGTVYMSFVNSTDPDSTIKGVLRVARLRFRSIGQPGERLQLHGELLSLGDIKYPAGNLASRDLPTSIEKLTDVIIK